MNLSSPLATLLIASKGQAPEITGPHILIRNKLMSILQDRNEEIILSKPILVSLEEICPDSGTFIMQSIATDAVFSECLPRGEGFPRIGRDGGLICQIGHERRETRSREGLLMKEGAVTRIYTDAKRKTWSYRKIN